MPGKHASPVLGGGRRSKALLLPDNLEQCELPPAVLDKLPKIETHQNDPVEAAERIIADMLDPPEIEYAGDKAYYSLLTDRVILPPRELFASPEELYATAFHELGHATGSRSRPITHY